MNSKKKHSQLTEPEEVDYVFSLYGNESYYGKEYDETDYWWDWHYINDEYPHNMGAHHKFKLLTLLRFLGISSAHKALTDKGWK